MYQVEFPAGVQIGIECRGERLDVGMSASNIHVSTGVCEFTPGLVGGHPAWHHGRCCAATLPGNCRRRDSAVQSVREMLYGYATFSPVDEAVEAV